MKDKTQEVRKLMDIVNEGITSNEDSYSDPDYFKNGVNGPASVQIERDMKISVVNRLLALIQEVETATWFLKSYDKDGVVIPKNIQRDAKSAIKKISDELKKANSLIK